MKRVLNIFIVICLIGTMLFSVSAPAQAADFGYSGLGDIQYMWLHTNGNVRAIDIRGAVAEFDYLNWKPINGAKFGTASDVVARNYDPISKNILFFQRNGYNFNSFLYNTTTGEWINANAPYVLDIFGSSSDYSYLYNNKYYFVVYNPNLSIAIYDLQGNYTGGINTGVSTGWDSFKSNSFNGGGFITAMGHAGHNINQFVTVNLNNSQVASNIGYTGGRILNFDNNSNIGCAVGTESSKATIYSNSTKILELSYPGYYPSFAVFNGLNNIESGAVISVRVTNATPRRTVVFFNNTLVRDEASESPEFTFTTSCRDKFGNIIFGGLGGRVFVRSGSGVISTNTTFYTDYIIGDIAAKAEEARAAAVEARDKTVAVYNLVAAIPPKVNKVYTYNDSTATKSASAPTIMVDADGATHFQLSTDNNSWSAPIPISSGGTISLNPGLNKVYARAYNDKIPEALRTYGTGNITIFRL